MLHGTQMFSLPAVALSTQPCTGILKVLFDKTAHKHIGTEVSVQPHLTLSMRKKTHEGDGFFKKKDLDKSEAITIPLSFVTKLAYSHLRLFSLP